MKEAYRSPFPAFNVYRHSEPAASDIVYADTPALTNKATSAQFFVGTNFLVYNI